MLKILDIADDAVINSKVLIAKSTYQSALREVYPLINKLGIQRNILNKTFYTRLENDIVNGCIMPPLTLAIVEEIKTDMSSFDISDFDTWINNNIRHAFVLDGIQRLNILKKASENLDFPNQFNQTIYFNIVICDSMNELLYRMITLNNGQKAMSVKHQIEILTQNLLHIEKLKINIQTEKERSKNITKNSFSQSDITLAYLAFLTNSINVDNQKIIDSKMDEILVNKVVENEAIYSKLEFFDIANNIIVKFSEDEYCFKWFNNTNNIIGFFVGIGKSYEVVKNENIDTFKNNLINFENSFKDLNISKIKVGSLRRKLVSYFFEHYNDLKNVNSLSLSEVFLDNNLI